MKSLQSYQQLRQKHSTFVYKSFDYSIENELLSIAWHFKLEPDISFKPTLTIPVSEPEVKKLQLPKNKHILENLIFNIGMIELLSYWKASCSPQILIEAGSLSNAQINWWHDLLIKGLGEFFYTNQIDFTQKDFVKITAVNQQTPKKSQSKLSSKKIIVPLGGGKDSTVSLEVLKNLNGYQVQPWSLNPIPAAKATARHAGFSNLRTSARTIDPTLLALNKTGYLNGHTPFSAYLAFYYALIGWLTDTKYIVLSNEASANECNVIYKNHEINHQYSKTFEFEQLFRQYSQQYLVADLEYFSFLRPLHELQIAKLFAQFPNHFKSFRSCNRGQKTNSWCHDCPKCLFAFIMLFPFIDQSTLTSQIFHKNLFESDALIQTALDLVTPDSTKPFECVGSYEESKVAFYLAIEHYRRQKKPLPKMLKTVWEDILQHQSSLGERATTILDDWNSQHNLSSIFTSVLKKRLKTNNSLKSNLSISKVLQQFQHKRILIWGMGREGMSTYSFLRKHFPNQKLFVCEAKVLEANSDQVRKIVADDQHLTYLEQTKDLFKKYTFDYIFKSPGISPYQGLAQQALNQTKKFWSNTKLFFELVDQQPQITTIGVTGTKGKSTTAMAINQLLKTAGKETFLVGNIGQPALDMIENLFEAAAKNQTYPVLELSSHQLLDLEKSPNIAVIQALGPEHLDYYPNVEAYYDAKAAIAQYQRQQDMVLFYKPSDEATSLAQLSSAQTKIEFSLEKNEDLIPENKLPLKGRHNKINILPSILIAKYLKINPEIIEKALTKLKPLPHRLALVSTINGVSYYNDSLATTPEATIEALNAFADQEIILLAGGYERNQNYQQLAQEIIKNKIKLVLLFPTTGKRLAQEIRKASTQLSSTIPEMTQVKSMSEAVKIARKTAQSGDIVLLSPAAASFNLFKDYADRGNQFKSSLN